ncbi:hypothetical protein ZIOFF_069795 [Zingiber officinale]|uniref:Katanin p80 WD40 repeat-containing subunit B1 homolog n=1 Tax=Zingiber officinale TaxID=94328 RepID=A0A8J5C4M6_ZINOF|nr:hypothetical protein ZIOFF_069795 [Zingiber officinale]
MRSGSREILGVPAKTRNNALLLVSWTPVSWRPPKGPTNYVSFVLLEFVAHSSNVNCLKIGRKTSRVLVTGGEDRKVNVWAIGKPNAILSLSGHMSAVESVNFDSSEVLVAAGATSGSNCIAVDFHPFGEFFASGSLDTNLKIWDIRRKGCIHTYKGHTRGVNAVKFTPDGRWVVSGGEDNIIKLWDLTAGKLLHEFKIHEGQIQCIDFHPHEFLLASGETKVEELEKMKFLTLCIFQDLFDDASVYLVALSSSGFRKQQCLCSGQAIVDEGVLWLASLSFMTGVGSADKTVKFWDIETFEFIGSSGPEPTIYLHSCALPLGTDKDIFTGWPPSAATKVMLVDHPLLSWLCVPHPFPSAELKASKVQLAKYKEDEPARLEDFRAKYLRSEGFNQLFSDWIL